LKCLSFIEKRAASNARIEHLRQLLYIMFKEEKNEIKNNANSKYKCQYHIVFAPYRGCAHTG